MKDRLYMEQMQLMRAQARPQEPEFTLTPEETGLDPQTHNAILKAAEKITTHRLQKERQQFNGLIGQMANELEMTKFVAEYGVEKKKYLPLIKEYQQRHAQATGGGFMDAETAYKLVRFDEMDAKATRERAVAPTAEATSAPSVPSAAGTRTQSTPQSGTAKGFHELSLEEQEARLEEQFGTGALI